MYCCVRVVIIGEYAICGSNVRWLEFVCVCK